MRSLIAAAALLLLLVYGSYGQGIHQTYELSYGSNLASTWDGSALLPWGLGFGLRVTPTWQDLLSLNGTIVNNTDLVYTFKSFPDGQILFEPSTFVFAVTVPASVVTDIASDADVIFTPSSMVLRFTPYNMSASFQDPVWSFNLTNDNVLLPIGQIVYMEYTEACMLTNSSVPCDIITPTYSQNVSLTSASSRPLTLSAGSDVFWNDNSVTDYYYHLAVHRSITPFRPSADFQVALPLQDGSDTSIANLVLRGTATGPLVRWTNPGFQNSGGNLTISIYSVWREYNINDTFVQRELVDPAPVSMFPASVTINVNSPVAVFNFNADIPWTASVGGIDYQVSSYYVWFSVVESSASPSLIDTAGFPQGAYSLPSIVLLPVHIAFAFEDLPTTFGQPILIGTRKTGSYRYHVHVAQSPFDMGMGAAGTITYPFQINPPGAFRILVATDSTSSSFVQVDSFVWTGSQRTIEFVIDTQDSPSGPAGVNWTFSDPVFAPPRALGVFDLLDDLYVFNIVPNIMDVKVTNLAGKGRVEDGITPNQPFSVLFSWAPPTNNGFLITVDATGVVYPDGSSGGSFSFTVGAGQTAFLAGPFKALPPTNLGQSYADQTVIPMLVSLGALPGGASDNTWFLVASPIVLRVRRDRVYIVNPVLTQQESTKKRYTVPVDGSESWAVEMLSAGGFPSQPYCVGVSLQSQFFDNDKQEVWVTPYAETAELGAGGAPAFINRAGLIFYAINNPAPAAGVSRQGMPPGTVVLSKANNATGCFVVAFDRNWPFLSDPMYDSYHSNIVNDLIGWLEPTIGLWRVHAAIHGPSSGLAFEVDASGESEILQLPDLFAVVRPSIRWSIVQFVSHPPRGDDDPYQFFAGETGLIYVTLDEPAQQGLNYVITLANGILQAVNVSLVDGKPGFPPGSQGPHVWSVRFDGIRKSAFLDSSPYNQYVASALLWTYGADAAYYLGNGATIRMAVFPQLIHAEIPDSSAPTFVGLAAGPFSVSILTPVMNDVTLVPVPRNGAAGALVFNPPQITFTSESPHVQHYTVSVDANVAPYQLGYWSWHWRLTGTDANITLLDDSTLDQDFVIHVVRRPAPLLMGGVPDDFVAGVTYGPIDVKVSVPLLPGEIDPLVLTPISNAFTFTPAALTFQVGQLQQVFSMRRDPIPELAEGVSPEVWVSWQMTGSNAWKYEYADLGIDGSPFYKSFMSRRSVSIRLPDAGSVRARMTYTGSVSLDRAPPADISIAFSSDAVTATPASLSFTPSSPLTAYFSYRIDDDTFVDPADGGEPVMFYSTISGLGAIYYNQPSPIELSPITQVIDSVTVLQMNPDLQDSVWMLNQPSQLITLTATAPPEKSMILTFKSDYLEFTPKSLTFSPGVLTQSFSFTPIAIPATQTFSSRSSTLTSPHMRVSILLTGVDAAQTSITNLADAFESIVILPEIDISPIAPIYTDGQSETDVFVSLKDASRLSPSVPVEAGAYNSFTIHIIPEDITHASRNVYVEPSVLEFSSADTTKALRSFSIQHRSASLFKTQTLYNLQYLLKFNGALKSQVIDITAFVPLHARRVLLKRYNIVPQFPKVLSYGWQEASMNLTRAPAARFALVPYHPLLDGQDNTGYSGHATAGGRIQFEPSVVVFAPGQVVQTFQVKADRGIDSSGKVLYYRVDWKIVAHPDDAYNFVEYVAPRSEGHFSTWHVASAMSSFCCSTAMIMTMMMICAALLAL